LSLDLNVDSVVDDVTSGRREFHVRDAVAGKARSPIVQRRVEGTAMANVTLLDWFDFVTL